MKIGIKTVRARIRRPKPRQKPVTIRLYGAWQRLRIFPSMEPDLPTWLLSRRPHQLPDSVE